MPTLENWHMFTDAECVQLYEWQTQFEDAQDERLQPAIRRLEFAKWLVDNNILNEFNVIESTEAS